VDLDRVLLARDYYYLRMRAFARLPTAQTVGLATIAAEVVQSFHARLDSEPRRLLIAIRGRGSYLECHTLAAPAGWLPSQPLNSTPPYRCRG
jgi:hypothetical protein